MKNHPHLYRLYNIYLNETEPFRKVHRLIDCFECFIKMYTAVLLCEYYNRNDISNEMRQLLYEGLRNPSLGTWQKFSHKIFDELKIRNHEFLITDFGEGFENLKKYVERNSENNLIEFRNIYAHGATPSNSDCLTHIKQFSPYLDLLINENWLNKSETYINRNTQKVYIKNHVAQSLSLFPILVTESDGLNNSRIVYFNDLDYNNADVGLLNYITAKRFREKELFTHFNKTYRLTQWKNASKTKDYEKKRLIDDLTVSFTGREKEKKFANDFITNYSKGFLTITGNPGMGKSTLIAEVFNKLDKTYSSDIYPILYFIQRGSGNDAYSLLKYLHAKIDETKILSNKNCGNNTQEMFNSLKEKLNLWSQKSKGKKLLIIIDGLDEGIEPPNSFITDYLFNQLIPQVLFIYSTRPGGHDKIVDFLDILPRENTSRLALAGLTKENIRSLLYEVTNKYEIEQEWVDVILEKSQGSALYLKLLCKDLQQDRIVINNSNALPQDINECYDRIFRNYRKHEERDTILNSIFLFAVAKDCLTQHHLELILGIGSGNSLSVISVLKEVLLVAESNSNAFILFHESLRDYIFEKYPSNILEAHKKMVGFCEKWETLKGKFEQVYALDFFSYHLFYLSEFESYYGHKLLELAKTKGYQQMQFNILKQFNSSYILQELALTISANQNNEGDTLEFACNILQLYKHEHDQIDEIFKYLSEGNLKLVLERINGIKGWDAYENKFLTYIICLFKIIIEDKIKQEIIELNVKAILESLDKNIPSDLSLFKWSSFMPVSLLFSISKKLFELNIEIEPIWKRAEFNILSDMNLFEDSIFTLLFERNNWKSQDQEFYNKIFNSLDDESKCIAIDRYSSLIESMNFGKYDSNVKENFENKINKYNNINQLRILLKDLNFKSHTIFSGDYEDFKDNFKKQNSYLNQKEFSNALEIHSYYKNDYFKQKSLINISGRYAEIGDFKSSFNLLIKSLKIRLKIEEEPWKSILNCELLAKNFSENSAIENVSQMFVNSLLFYGKYKYAIEVYNNIASERERIGSLKDILIYCINNSLGDEMKFLLNIYLEETSKSNINYEFQLNIISLNLLKNGFISEAIQLTEKFIKINYKCDSILNIAEYYFELKLNTKAQNWISENLRLINQIDDLMDKTVIQARTSYILTKYCYYKLAEDIFISAYENINLDKKDHSHRISCDLLQALAFTDKISKALLIIENIKDEYWQARAKKEYSLALFKNNQINDAFKIIHSILRGKQKIEAYKEISLYSDSIKKINILSEKIPRKEERDLLMKEFVSSCKFRLYTPENSIFLFKNSLIDKQLIIDSLYKKYLFELVVSGRNINDNIMQKISEALDITHWNQLN